MASGAATAHSVTQRMELGNVDDCAIALGVRVLLTMMASKVGYRTEHAAVKRGERQVAG